MSTLINECKTALSCYMLDEVELSFEDLSNWMDKLDKDENMKKVTVYNNYIFLY